MNSEPKREVTAVAPTGDVKDLGISECLRISVCRIKHYVYLVASPNVVFRKMSITARSPQKTSPSRGLPAQRLFDRRRHQRRIFDKLNSLLGRLVETFDEP